MGVEKVQPINQNQIVNMKFLVLLSALSSVAFARPGLVQVGHAVVPAETPAVAAIKSQYNLANLGLGVSTVNGAQLVQHPGAAVTPLDTPSVAAIKSQYNPANVGIGAINVNGMNLVQHPGGAVTPVDPPAVAAIKSQYSAALGLGPATDAGATINGIPILLVLMDRFQRKLLKLLQSSLNTILLWGLAQEHPALPLTE